MSVQENSEIKTLVNDLIQAGQSGYSNDIFSLRNQIRQTFDAVSSSPEQSEQFGKVVDRLIDNLNGGYAQETHRLRNEVIERYSEAAL